MKKLGPYWKAVIGFIAPGAVVIGSAVQDSSQGGSHIVTAEWVTAGVACIVTSVGVFYAPRKAAPAPEPDA